MFSEMRFLKMKGKGDGGFKKKALRISVRQTNFSCATTLPWYGTGRSGVLCSFWHGASKCSGSPTMDTFSVAPCVAAVTQARIVTFLGGRVTT
jgi:hypothetical protein